MTEKEVKALGRLTKAELIELIKAQAEQKQEPAPEIIRCENCRSWKAANKYCGQNIRHTSARWYCAGAVKK